MAQKRRCVLGAITTHSYLKLVHGVLPEDYQRQLGKRCLWVFVPCFWGVGCNEYCVPHSFKRKKKNLSLPVETAVSIKSSVGFYICFIVCLFFEQSLLNLMN